MNALNELWTVEIVQRPEFSNSAHNFQKLHFWPKNKSAQNKSRIGLLRPNIIVIDVSKVILKVWGHSDAYLGQFRRNITFSVLSGKTPKK